MLSTRPISFTFDDDDDWHPPTPPRIYRSASVRSWGVTSFGRGFDWDNEGATPKVAEKELSKEPLLSEEPVSDPVVGPSQTRKQHLYPTPIMTSSPQPMPSSSPTLDIPQTRSPLSSTPSSPRPRRRSSQQRVSLIAGRISIAPIDPPEPPPMLSQNLRRTPSSGSTLSTAVSTRAPSPSADPNQSFLGERNISEFLIESEIGRGAYGLVKRAREIREDGTFGPPLVIKQVIKQRILADCWKKHPKHGTIPVEIYVMNSISNTSYILPPKRPWDPSRTTHKAGAEGKGAVACETKDEESWVEGKVVKGHPNICPLLDFFEDSHYYYLVLPSSTPEHLPNEPAPPSDLFDLVEAYPQGLPPHLIRTYLGQIADALCFLHSHGIVHRDVKDENVVLGPNGRCILIDFGSSGLVKKSGWDTFSGTLDYAGPEILRGERYFGKEQDVWAFGVVAYVLLVGECPFMTAEEAQEGFGSPFANASISLDERCADGKETEGEEEDGGGALGDAAALVRACLQVEVSARPTFEKILQCRFLAGNGGWQ